MTFAELTARFVGKPYSEYGKGPDSFGCLGLCYAFLKAAGKDIDEASWQHQGFSTDNFMEHWHLDPCRLEAVMLEAAERVGTAVDVHGKVAGDLVILKTRLGRFFPGIYVGNGNVMASYADAGVRVFSIDNDGMTAVKVRRF